MILIEEVGVGGWFCSERGKSLIFENVLMVIINVKN